MPSVVMDLCALDNARLIAKFVSKPGARNRPSRCCRRFESGLYGPAGPLYLSVRRRATSRAATG
jgi:hypothetical protein